MSGIVGIYRLDGGPVDPTLLQRMTDRMSYRGPDGVGHWTNECVGFGHQMLHTTTESLDERQPLTDEPGTLCLVLDGRVDNRDELRVSLKASGLRLRNDTDAELVLRAYECWGEECPSRILGDFAFAIWDTRKRQLFCARDPLGIKPFYYWQDSGALLFASEMQPLFEWPPVQRRPNLPLIGLYISNRFNEREETLYEGVLRLPAAHALVVRDGGCRKFRYWDLDPERSIRHRTDDEYARHFLSVFQEAVRAHLRSHRPVGAMLSGGLDSSSIVCTAQKLCTQGQAPGNGFEAFSILFDTFPCDERVYVDEVVQHSGVKANVFTHEDDLSWVDLDHARYPHILYSTSLRFFGPALSEAHRRGFRAVLDGVGGDELMACGFDHLTDLARAGRLRDLRWQLRHDAEIYLVSPRELFFTYCVKPFVPAPVKEIVRPLLRPWRGNGTSRLLRSEFVRATSLVDRANQLVVVPKFPTRAQQTIYNGLAFGWNATVVPESTDLFYASFGLELRHPFLDRRLVEFLIAIPEEQRWRGDRPKTVLRHAMAGLLPESVRWRKGKAEFSATMDHELRRRQAHKVERLCRNSTLAALGVVDGDCLVRLFERYRRGTGEYLTGTIELLVALELWCSAVLERGEQRNGVTHTKGQRPWIAA